MLTFKLSKVFCPKRCSWLTWGNRGQMWSACCERAPLCTGRRTLRLHTSHFNTQLLPQDENAVHFRLDYVSVWWIVTPSAGKASLCNETKSIWRSWRINVNTKNQLEVRSWTFTKWFTVINCIHNMIHSDDVFSVLLFVCPTRHSVLN